jgi:hypothetical protein
MTPGVFSYEKFEREGNLVNFYYQIEIPQKAPQIFVHTLDFQEFGLFQKSTDPNIQRMLFLIGMFLIPYYYTPLFLERIIVKAGKIESGFLEFFDDFFQKGLAEFMYKNKIPFKTLPRIEIVATQSLPPFQKGKERRKGFLVGHGGGKDSIVSGLLLQKANIDFSYFVLSHDALRLETSQINFLEGYSAFIVQQNPYPAQFAKSFVEKNGGFLGHRPLSGYLGMLGVFAAYLLDKKGFIVSNEASASTGNLYHEGVEINHQYSKGYEAEKKFRSFLQQYCPVEVEYFSLLRPISELRIAKIFSENPQYLSTFMSCNKGILNHKWCGECPKCAFVFLFIGAYINLAEAKKLFSGVDLLADPTLENTFLELLGLQNHKPFECVGEYEECQIMFHKIIQENALSNNITTQFLNAYKETNFQSLEAKWMNDRNKHFIPSEIFQKIESYL